MKRIVTLLLSVLLVVSTLPVMSLSVFASDENIALGKPAIDGGSGAAGYDPAVITDGNLNGMWTSKDDKEFTGPWVGVDLEDQYVITEVILHNAIGFPEAYRRGVDIEFSNTPDFAVKESVTAMGRGVGDESPNGVPVVVKAPSNKPYRYVRAIKTQNTTHIVNELEVYGTLYDPNALKISKDVVGTEFEGAVTFLTYLGLVKPENEEDEIFGVNSVMTRGEAVEAIVCAFGDGISFNGWVPFADVTQDNPYYPVIATAYYMGLITGDDGASFRPDDYTTVSEFLIMTLRAIGYQDIAEKVFNHNVAKMLNQVEKLGLTKDAGLHDYAALITRGEMAKVFYNALLAPQINLSLVDGEWLAYEDGTDLLDKKHKMTLTKGVVEENRISTLDGTQKASKSAAKISGQSFVDVDGKLDGFLGKQVIVLTSQDHPKDILLAWLTDRNEEIVLPTRVLVSTKADIESGHIAALDNTGRRETYDLEKEPYIIINGVADRYYSTEDLMPQNGQLRLLDNDHDGVYEVVFVEEYSLHYLKSGFNDATSVTIIDSTGLRQTLDIDSLTVTDGAGKSVAPKKVTADAVIKLFTSRDGSRNRIALYTEPVKGVLSAMSDKDIVVGKTTYPLSLAYRRMVAADEPIPGETVSVYVDEAGEAIWVERDLEAIQNGWTIAFSQKFALGSGLVSDLAMRLYTIDGAWKELQVADKVTVDGIVTTKAELANMLSADKKDTSYNYLVGELLRYQTDGNGKIKALDTITNKNEENDGTQRISVGTEIAAKTGLWTTNSGAFWNGRTMVGLGTKETPVFVLPRVKGGYATDSSYDSAYKVSRLDNVIASHTSNSRALLPYMADKFGYPGCFVVYDEYSEGGSKSTFVTSDNAPFMLVEKIITTVNSNGEIVYQLDGHNITDGSVSENVSVKVPQELEMIEIGELYQNEADCFDSNKMVMSSEFSKLSDKENYIKSVRDIGIGDVVRCQSTASGVIAVDRIFHYEESQPVLAGPQTSTVGTYYECSENASAFTVAYRFQVGTFELIDSTAFTIKTLADQRETYKIKSFTNVYTIDLTGAKPKLVKVKDLSQYEGAEVQALVHVWKGNPRVVIVYPH